MTTSTKEPTENQDIESIEAAPTRLTLLDGTQVEVERLKTRQLFRLLKVLTVGAGDFLGSINLSADMESEEFVGNLLAALVLAIPEAEDESIEFLLSMVSPADLITGDRLSKNEEEINAEKYTHLQQIMFNPEIDDTYSVIERVVQIEAPHIQALGKRLRLLLETQQKATVAKQGGSSRKTSKA